MKIVLVASVLASVAFTGCGKYEAATRSITPPILKTTGGASCDPALVLSDAIARNTSGMDPKTIQKSPRVTTEDGSAQGWSATSTDGKPMLGVELVDQTCINHGAAGVVTTEDISALPAPGPLDKACDPTNALLSTIKTNGATAKSISVSTVITANATAGGATAASWIVTMPDGTRELGIFEVDKSCKVLGLSAPLK